MGRPRNRAHRNFWGMTHAMMRLIGKVALAITLLSLLPLASNAQTYHERSGRTWTCYAPHRYTGEIVPVYGQNGHAGGFWAVANYTNTGWPIIIFDVQELRQYPEIVVRYTYYHECAHLSIPTTDEIEANCVGLLNMRENNDVSPHEEKILRKVHYSLPFLPPQYGGSGRVFWDATIDCAGPP